MKHILSIFAASVLFTAHTHAADFDLQAAINAATAGDIVNVPAGEYKGPIKLKDGVLLVGAGAETTIIDGQGQGTAVHAAKFAGIVGFTVRNALNGIHNGGQFIGVFECVFEGYQQFGLRLEGGSAVVANNHIRSVDRGTGIASFNSNPLIINNVIESNVTGIHVIPHLVPTIADNVFSRNRIGIRLDGEAKAILRNNVFSGGGETIRGGSLDASDIIRDLTAEDFELPVGQNTAAYLELMRRVHDEAASLQSRVVYDLGATPGRFGLGVFMPWATFNIGASTIDTVIETYDAYDRTTDAALNASFKMLGDRPSIDVSNPEITEKQLDRFVCEKIFVHPESYKLDNTGNLTFDRVTNLTRIEVKIPASYHVVEANPGALIESDASGREVVKLTEMGTTRVRIVMQR